MSEFHVTCMEQSATCMWPLDLPRFA